MPKKNERLDRKEQWRGKDRYITATSTVYETSGIIVIPDDKIKAKIEGLKKRQHLKTDAQFLRYVMSNVTEPARYANGRRIPGARVQVRDWSKATLIPVETD